MAPLFHVRKEAPPLLLVTGGRELEILGRYEENACLWRMMKVAGHELVTPLELDGFDHEGMPDPPISCFSVSSAPGKHAMIRNGKRLPALHSHAARVARLNLICGCRLR